MTYTNHMPNPSAEVDATGYVDFTTLLGGGATIASSTDQAHAGTRSFKVTCTTPADLSPILGSPMTGVMIAFPEVVAALNDDTILSVFVRSGTGTSGNALSLGDGSANESSTIPVSWGSVSIATVDNISELVAGSLLVECEAADTFYFDAVYVAINESLPPDNYGDGDSPGWEWDGTPHASTSTGEPILPHVQGEKIAVMRTPSEEPIALSREPGVEPIALLRTKEDW